MGEPLAIDVVTIFPRMLKGFLEESMMKRAAAMGVVRFRMVNPRDFATDRHRTTDDRPYGGGVGMIMMPGPMLAAVESVMTMSSRIVLMSPQGQRFDQKAAIELATEKHLIFVCGHYEGVDERVREKLDGEEISVGDYVLTNGALAAAVVVDAVVRLLPGVVGGKDATLTESFSNGLLDYPQYTRPPEFRGMKVPEVLLSGDHEEIARWRADQARERTKQRRPDLLSPRQSDESAYDR